ncbi:hypothetical protein FA13DRAFT_1788093 [Coprinellus micaceus]|uniref:Pkr1-domain-containing protein n=1 Tax=Coprinellus micaceus TaxID=71717 RepID=A0A4Y7TMN6_COPMI|nr:hypothetical protein FA13DRAFT_1788093 [Coprinellus micaceus]
MSNTGEHEAVSTPGGEASDASSLDSFFSNILTPGSSLHPTFQIILDGAFAALFTILLTLAILTSGNPHIFALIIIELALWASVKWFVNELKRGPASNASERVEKDGDAVVQDGEEEKKDQ